MHKGPIELPATGLVASLVGGGVALRDLCVGTIDPQDEPAGWRRAAAAQFTPASRLLAVAQPGSSFVAGATITRADGTAIALAPPLAAAPAEAAPQHRDAPPVAAAEEAASSDAGAGLRKWFDVHKALGPVQLARVGCEWYGSGRVGLLLDAAVDIGGLHLGLSGLGVSFAPFDLKHAHPQFVLRGIDVRFRDGPVTIGGALYETTIAGDAAGTSTTQYDGLLTLRAADFTVSAFGSYAVVAGAPSLFVFGVLRRELGGSPAFRVYGLAAGFGYNRRLRLPAVDQVAEFPLVQAASDPKWLDPVTPRPPLPAPMAQPAAAPDPVRAALERLHTFVPPAPGQYWLAAGIRFKSFEMVDSFALLGVSFGSEFSISVLGVSRISVPAQPASGQAPLCRADLALRAEFNPTAGVFSVQAQLGPASYVFSTDCKLSGGFAFCTWFKGPHQGDFVISLGGYHAAFKRPDHYPLVPRLALDWVVTPQVRITGELYFALTPRCVMAGGRLSAVYDGGWVRAWFTAYADFLIAWKPYHYEGRFGVSIGASVTIRINLLFVKISKTFTFQLGAELEVAGPPFAGTARVHFYIVSFTVGFGGPRAARPKVDWAQFRQSFLPADDAVCTVRVSRGLLRERPAGDAPVPVVNAHEMALDICTQVPCTAIRWSVNGQAIEATTLDAPSAPLGVAPVDAPDTSLRSELEVAITGPPGASGVPVSFMAEALVQAFPKALWARAGDRSEGDLVTHAAAGVRLQTAASLRGSAVVPVEGTESLTCAPRQPWRDIAFAAPLTPPSSPLGELIAGDAVVEARRAAVLALLRAITPRPLHDVDLAATAVCADRIFQSQPRFGGPGERLPAPELIDA